MPARHADVLDGIYGDRGEALMRREFVRPGPEEGNIGGSGHEAQRGKQMYEGLKRDQGPRELKEEKFQSKQTYASIAHDVTEGKLTMVSNRKPSLGAARSAGRTEKLEMSVPVAFTTASTSPITQLAADFPSPRGRATCSK